MKRILLEPQSKEEPRGKPDIDQECFGALCDSIKIHTFHKERGAFGGKIWNGRNLFYPATVYLNDEWIHKINTAPTFFAGDAHAKGMITMDRRIVRTNKE